MNKQRWSISADKFLTHDQVLTMFEYLKSKRDLAFARSNDVQAIRDYYMIRALLESGLRVFEFCALVNSDFVGHKLVVRHGKGDKRRTVLLTKATALMLTEWSTVMHTLALDISSDAPMFPSRYGQAYTTRGVQKRVKAIFAQLHFHDSLSVHSLRHTYCSMLLSSGKVSIATVKENLGHHSIAVTNLYAHAVGDLSEVELYSARSSEKADYSEPDTHIAKKKPLSSVEAFLRNTNLKPGEPEMRKRSAL